MRFHVSLGSPAEISAAYRKHVLNLEANAYEAEVARRRAAGSQKKIPSHTIPSDKIHTELGEPTMYKLISATLPESGAVQAPQRQEPQEHSCWPHVASNPACSSSRGEEEDYAPRRTVPIYADNSFGKSIVGMVEVPDTRFTPMDYPFRDLSSQGSRGMNIRMIPAELENATEAEVTAFLQKKRREVEIERSQHARTMNVNQGARFLAERLKPSPSPQDPQYATGIAPEVPSKPRKRKRKPSEKAVPEPELEPEPEPTSKTETEVEPEPEPEKEVEVEEEEKEREEQKAEEEAGPAPAKKQRTSSVRGRRSKRAPATKAAEKSEEPPPAEDDLDSF